jgi:endonuclease/exonuclease/phosphatase family metal-dependent hydrolase
MRITVGKFNLNNLFSRFDFSADVSTASASDVKVEERTQFSFDDPSGFALRTYQGRLVRGKSDAERKLTANRIKRMDLDVLAVQEVEDIDTLRHFVRDDLGGLYRYVVLIEGNDPRLIDVGVLSKLPLGGVTSWQYTPDPLNPDEPVFSRDLLQVDVMSADRRRRLFTVFNNHLKSHFVAFNARDPEAEQQRANERRQRQCRAAAAIIAAQTRPNGRYIVVGDMNDPPDSASLEPLVRRAQAQPVLRPERRDPDAPRAGQPTAAQQRLDRALQALRPTGRLHPHGPNLAQPDARRQEHRGVHRAPHQGRRRRQRPRPRLGGPRPVGVCRVQAEARSLRLALDADVSESPQTARSSALLAMKAIVRRFASSRQGGIGTSTYRQTRPCVPADEARMTPRLRHDPAEAKLP